MNLSVFDSNNGRFSNILRFHWQAQGHSVFYTPLWDSRECVGKDAIFFDWVDTSVQRASNPEDSQYKDHGTTIPSTTNIIARCHDIDMWAGNLGGVKDNFIRHLVFVADHIRAVAEKRGEIPKGCQVHTIRHGIDPDKYTFRPQPAGTKKIGWVGNYEHKKNPELALWIMMELSRDYEIHMVARRRQAPWQIPYWDALIAKNNIKVVFEEDLGDMNAFWEDKDFALITSGKEAFSYVAGEAMMKGVKPIIHRFFGADEVWPSEYIFDSVSQAVKMITNDVYVPQEYREVVLRDYPISKFFTAYDELIKG